VTLDLFPDDVVTPQRARWGAGISKAWREGLEAILKTGRLLIAAKADPKMAGHYEAMVEKDLPFGPRTARMWVSIARDERLTDRKHVSVLPPSWGTLYQLSRLTDEDFEARLAAGDIKPDLERNEIATWRRVASREADQIRVSNLTPVEGRHRTLVIDPPWDYGPLSIAGRAATPRHDGDLAGPRMVDFRGPTPARLTL